jgi:Zn-dependent M28 family amino/carboxypeptidase
LRDASTPGPLAPVVLVWGAAVRDALAAAPDAEIKVSARIPAPTVEPVKLRNVAGILRGADDALKDTYLVLTAHYDHLGIRLNGEGDRIYNGANDDASGTASLIEIARAMAALPAKPKRSVVFIALFGEEVGEIGSLYYVRHPLFPLAKTIADINLEQLGRTDDSAGPKPLQFNLTGFGYTTLAATFQKAAEEAGVRAVNDPKNSDAYFARSDNVRFAVAGVPSTTISVAYMFPDYHAVGDEWPKLDYDNMAKVDCALALAAFDLADSAEAPQWNADEARTAPYVKAREADK